MKYLKENNNTYQNINYEQYSLETKRPMMVDLNQNEINIIFSIFSTLVDRQTSITIKKHRFYIDGRFYTVSVTKSSDDYFILKLVYHQYDEWNRKTDYYKCDQLNGLKNCLKNEVFNRKFEGKI